MNTLFGLVCRSTLLFLPLICFGDPSKIAPDLASADPHSKIDVIVQFVLPPSDDDIHGVNQLGGVPQQGDLDLIRASSTLFRPKPLPLSPTIRTSLTFRRIVTSAQRLITPIPLSGLRRRSRTAGPVPASASPSSTVAFLPKAIC